MKSFYMLKLPVILLGVGGALLLSPVGKAQEVSPQSFTDTGVQDYYEAAPAKPAKAPVKQKAPAVAAHKQQAGSSATLQPAVERSASAAKQPSTQAVAEKRKTGSSAPKKQ